eukprot:jgi/Bigna1/81682/fgenesh1_pg.83_\
MSIYGHHSKEEWQPTGSSHPNATPATGVVGNEGQDAREEKAPLISAKDKKSSTYLYGDSYDPPTMEEVPEFEGKVRKSLIVVHETDIRKEEKIGEGQFAVAWRAVRLNDQQGEAVAWKIPITYSTEEYMREMMGLYMAQGTEEHNKQAEKNMMRFIGIVIDTNGVQSFLSEYCSLGSVADLQKTRENGKRILMEKFWDIAKGLFLGLSHLHANGLVHRDISYDNLQDHSFTYNLFVFSSNFLIALYMPQYPHYFELGNALRKRRFTSKSDTWAAGVAMWEILHEGRRPYSDSDGKWPKSSMEMQKDLAEGRLSLRIDHKQASDLGGVGDDDGDDFKKKVDFVNHLLTPSQHKLVKGIATIKNIAQAAAAGDLERGGPSSNSGVESSSWRVLMRLIPNGRQAIQEHGSEAMKQKLKQVIEGEGACCLCVPKWFFNPKSAYQRGNAALFYLIILSTLSIVIAITSALASEFETGGFTFLTKSSYKANGELTLAGVFHVVVWATYALMFCTFLFCIFALGMKPHHCD